MRPNPVLPCSVHDAEVALDRFCAIADEAIRISANAPGIAKSFMKIPPTGFVQQVWHSRPLLAGWRWHSGNALAAGLATSDLGIPKYVAGFGLQTQVGVFACVGRIDALGCNGAMRRLMTIDTGRLLSPACLSKSPQRSLAHLTTMYPSRMRASPRQGYLKLHMEK